MYGTGEHEIDKTPLISGGSKWLGYHESWRHNTTTQGYYLWCLLKGNALNGPGK